MKDWIEMASLEDLTAQEKARYSRHLVLPHVGAEGQRRLKSAKVLVVGTGGLGSPVSMYLAAAGVGNLGIVDFDAVDASNLQRQIVHGTSDVGTPKVISAQKRLQEINPYIKVIPHGVRLTSQNALELFKDYDIIVDGTDNFQSRYLINDACVFLGKPNVYGSIFRFEGQVGVLWAKHGACYRCLYPEPPPPDAVPSCTQAGVLGVLPGIIGTIQANEVIKLILGSEGVLINRLVLLDSWTMKFQELDLSKDPACPICGKHPTQTDFVDYEQFCMGSRKSESCSAAELKILLDQGADIDLVDVREPYEFEDYRIAQARNIPLGEIVARMNELHPHQDTVLICKMGIRSLSALKALQQAGYGGRLINLDLGMMGWVEGEV